MDIAALRFNPVGWDPVGWIALITRIALLTLIGWIVTLPAALFDFGGRGVLGSQGEKSLERRDRRVRAWTKEVAK